MGNYGGRLVYCWLASLAIVAQVAVAVPYEIRVWRNVTYGTAYGLAYRSAGESFDRFAQDFDLKGVSYYTGGAEAGYCSSSDGRCPMWTSANYTHFRHKCTSGSTGVIGKRKIKNQWLAINYPSALHTVTNVVTFPLFQCKRCMTGSGEHDEGVLFSSSLCSSDTDLLPIWVWYSDKIKNFVPIYNEAGNQATGGNFDFDPSKLPDGAIPEGDGKNGDWKFDGLTEPHWEWTPGMEPQMDKDTLAGYLGDILTQLEDMNQSMGGGENAPPEGFWANLGDNMRAWVQSGVSPFQDAVQAGFDDLIAAMPETPEPEEPVDLGPVIAAIHGVNGSVQVVGGKVDAVGVKIDAVAGKVEAGNVLLGDIKDKLTVTPDGSLGSFTPSTLAPFAPFNEYAVPDPGATGENDSSFSAVFGLFSGFESVVGSIQGKVSNLGNALVGNWAAVGSVPAANIPVDCWGYSFVINLEKFNDFFRLIRPIEVVCIWIIFLLAVMKLIGSMFGGGE